MLYHGSKTKIETNLEPRISFELQKWVYATNDYSYALIRCRNFDYGKFLIREEHEDGWHSLCEVYPGAFDEVFNRPGYIYQLDESYFKFNRGTEFISETEVPIINRIYIPNVLEELIKDKEHFELIKYEDSEDYWKKVRGGRDGYLERKRLSVEQIKKAQKAS